MSKKPNKRQVIRRFVETYLDKFNNNPDPTILLIAMMSDGLTDPIRLRNYMLIRDYYELLAEQNGFGKKTVNALADQYKITERQVQNILYKWTDKYRENYNISE